MQGDRGMTEALGDGVGVHGAVDVSGADTAQSPDGVPAYLRRTYAWAYLWPNSIRLLDRPAVVSAILWGNYGRLRDSALAEFQPGQDVLQPACVYGDFSPRLAGHLGPHGQLTVGDVAPQQVENCRQKLAANANTTVQVCDAADHVAAGHDAVCCFFCCTRCRTTTNAVWSMHCCRPRVPVARWPSSTITARMRPIPCARS